MCRKTYLSIGRALPGRTNIIVTRQTDFTAPDCTIAHSLEEALTFAKKSTDISNEVFCIGGGELYAQAMPLAQKLYITKVDAAFQGDTYFPEIKPSEWQEVQREDHLADEKNPYPYSFVTYSSIAPRS